MLTGRQNHKSVLLGCFLTILFGLLSIISCSNVLNESNSNVPGEENIPVATQTISPSTTVNSANVESFATNPEKTSTPAVLDESPFLGTETIEPESLPNRFNTIFSLEDASHELPENLKEEVVYYVGGGGGAPNWQCISPSSFHQRINPHTILYPVDTIPIKNYRYSAVEINHELRINTCGWQQNEDIVVEIWKPDGSTISAEIQFNVPGRSESEIDGLFVSGLIARTLDSTRDSLFVRLQTSPTDPLGKYKILIKGEHKTLLFTYQVDAPKGPRIVNIDNGFFLLYNFDPLENFRILAYKLCGTGVACFVGWQDYQVDENGSFEIKFDVVGESTEEQFGLGLIGDESGVFAFLPLGGDLLVGSSTYSFETDNPKTAVTYNESGPKQYSFTLIPGGEFAMGAGNDLAHYEEAEKPEHSVLLDPYWMMLTEVNNRSYRECVAAGVCTAPSSHNSATHINYFNERQFDLHPVIHVSFDQASTYCNWIGGRLPTEAEWEKAARYPDSRYFAWGNDLNELESNPNLANYGDKLEDTTHVDIFSYQVTLPDVDGIVNSTASGLIHMNGNVWEWTSDWFDPDYYASSPYENPTGPESGTEKVVRGGSWSTGIRYLSFTNRFNRDPEQGYDNVGFRCILPAIEE